MIILGKSTCMAAIPDTIKSSSLEYEYAFEEAIKQFSFGNYSQALFLFKKCLEVNSNSLASNYQMGNIYLMAGESQKGLGYARAAYEIDPSNKWVSMLLIKAYQLVDKNDSALIVMESLFKRGEDNLDLKYEYGNLLSSVGRYDEAIKIFNDIDSSAGLNEGTALARQQIFIQRKDFKHAVTELENLSKVFPDEIRYKGMLAELYSGLHDVDKAKSVYNTIFQTDSANILAMVSVADFYRDIKDYQNATLVLKKVLDNNAVQLDSKMGLIIAYIRNDSDLLMNKDLVRNSIGTLAVKYPSEIKIDKLLVDYFIRTNSYDSAIIVIEKFIGTEENPDIWEQYFRLLNSTKKYSTISLQYNNAKKYAKDIFEIYIISGIANIQLNRNKEAVDAMNEALNLKELKKEEISEILEYKAEALFKLKLYRESDSCFEEVLKREPLNYLVLNNYSYYLGLRDTALAKACKLSKRTVDKNPSNPVYLDTYGYLLMQRHKYRQAFKWLKKAVDYNTSEDADIFEHMGDVLFYLGRNEEARLFWKKAKDKGRNNLNIEDKVKSLKR